MVTGMIIGLALGLFGGFVIGHATGVRETERRWSEAVMRGAQERMREAISQFKQ